MPISGPHLGARLTHYVYPDKSATLRLFVGQPTSKTPHLLLRRIDGARGPMSILGGQKAKSIGYFSLHDAPGRALLLVAGTRVTDARCALVGSGSKREDFPLEFDRIFPVEILNPFFWCSR